MPTRNFYKLTGASLKIALAVFLFGCGGNQGNKDNQLINLDSTEVSEEVFNDVNQAKQIFYSLPSPLETAMLIKSAGAKYNENLLNPVAKASSYTTNRGMALNLGIYITDLSFASLFDQTQTSIKYMEAAKKMADGLGILDAIDNATIEKLEENVNNRDVIMDIISETFMSTSSFLKEADRPAVAAVVLVGGWFEGLYIATQMVDENNIKNNKLVDRIVDQKLSLDIVVKLLQDNKDNPDVQALIVQVADVKTVFDKIKITTSKVKPVLNEKTKVTTLESQSSNNLNEEIFKELKEKVKAVRNNFTL
jgi:hypothetical protein